MEHPTEIVLREYSDRMLDRGTQSAIDDHIRSCEECMLKLRTFRLLDEKLRAIPPERAEKDFTRRVMASLRIDPAPAVYWNIAKYMAPVLSLILVLTVVYAVFYFSGTIQWPDIRQSVGMGGVIGERAGAMTSEGIKALNAWGGKYFSFAIGSESFNLTIFLLIVFAGIAALDRYLLVPMMRKKI